MKHTKILRIFTAAVVLSLLLIMLPVLPVLAANTIALSPTSGKIGDNINVTGDSFTLYKSTPTNDYYAEIYFAEENVAVGKSIDIDVKTYKLVSESELAIDATTGDFSAVFPVPSELDDYTVAAYHDSVRTGTYYVYVTITKYPTNGADPTIDKTIRSKQTFAVTASAALDPLSPATGAAGTDVVISGANFPASTALVFKFDTVTITPKSGDTATRTSGIFLSTITIPASATASAHTITVTAGTGTATATFTVTASAALDPLSPATGAAGTDVVVSGASFLASYPIIFKFDTTTNLTPKSGDINTTTTGSFTSVITIPAGATAGAHNITVTVGTTTLSATFTVTATAALFPLDPETGPAGTEITVSGANCPANTALVFKLDTTTLTPKSDTDIYTRSNGTFYTNVTIPAGTTSGDHTIYVTMGTITLNATFTVTGGPTTTPTPTPPPSNAILAVATSGDNIGAQIAINGAGFTPGANVTFKYDDTVIATVKADPSGLVTKTFLAPPSKHGDHTITVSDGTNTATTKFTVESTAPPVPAPLSPATGAKVKTPITLDWTDVTDASLPVTYDIQIATNQTFAAGSILLDKKALDKSELVLTETEVTALASGGSPNYWRVKAVDAALNESAWSSVFDFHTSGGGGDTSGLPGWVWPLIGSVSGVLLLLIGFWFGRRTAFNY